MLVKRRSIVGLLGIAGVAFIIIHELRNWPEPLSGSTEMTISESRWTNKAPNVPEISPSTPRPRPRPSTPRSPTPRPMTCNGCFKQDIKYAINPLNLCKGANLSAMFVVFSEHSHFTRRATIRRTWASVANRNLSGIRMVFILGENSNAEWNAGVKQESKDHGDILLASFTDSRHNLTVKMVVGIGWAIRFCSNAKYFFKTDDDVWVNMPRFLLLAKQYDFDNAMGGYCYMGGALPVRNKQNKFYVSEIDYPQKTYPPYCVGTGIVMTMKLAAAVYKKSADIPFFLIDDVYISGLCREALNVKLHHLPGFETEKVPLDACNYRNNVVVSHHMTDSDMEKMWNTNCSKGPDIISNFTRN